MMPSSRLPIHWRHRMSHLIFLDCFGIGNSWQQQTYRHPHAMQRFYRLRWVFLRYGYQSVGGTGLPMAVPLLSRQTTDISRWTVTVSYFGIGYSWLPYLQIHTYVLQQVFRLRSVVPSSRKPIRNRHTNVRFIFGD